MPPKGSAEKAVRGSRIAALRIAGIVELRQPDEAIFAARLESRESGRVSVAGSDRQKDTGSRQIESARAGTSARPAFLARSDPRQSVTRCMKVY